MTDDPVYRTTSSGDGVDHVSIGGSCPRCGLCPDCRAEIRDELAGEIAVRRVIKKDKVGDGVVNGLLLSLIIWAAIVAVYLWYTQSV